MSDIEELKKKAVAEQMAILELVDVGKNPKQEDGWFSLDELFKMAKEQGDPRERTGFYSSLNRRTKTGELESCRWKKDVFFRMKRD